MLACAGLLAALAPAAGTTATGSGGGVVAPGKPKVADVRCLVRCVSGRKATPGAKVRLRGAFLNYTRRVVFRGPDGPIRARYLYRDARRVRTVVPKRALSSRPFVVDARGMRSNRSPELLRVVPASQIPKQIFPVRGPHRYWDGFGAGRGHDGGDIGAACGTRLVSAVAGRVQRRAWHSSAGHYVVIDSRHNNTDFVYAHLRNRAAVRGGQYVRAGDFIGAVGATGNAQGCHLHFEYWVGDWYGGGRPVDPMPYLRELDRKS